MSLSTPVLLLVFNRPVHTKKVLDRLREVRPEQLFIAADGPRPDVPSDADACAAVRGLFQAIDWPCTVKTLFREQNLGCREAVRTAIDWYFDEVEEGIILEDDCLPDPSFFSFCTHMLETYRYEEHVMHISGHNPAPQRFSRQSSAYVYSWFPLVWGWASWRRAWKLYKSDFNGLEEHWLQKDSHLHALINSEVASRYLLDKFRSTRDGKINTWDYAWFYTILSAHGWCVNPTRNLVENIGFDEAATHTRWPNWKRSVKAGSIDLPIRRPAALSRLYDLEQTFFYNTQKSQLGLMIRSYFPWLFNGASRLRMPNLR